VRERGSELAHQRGGAHVVTENATLIGAATIAGAYWGLLRAIGVPLGALVVSHVAWDIWIFLVAPTEDPGTISRRQAEA